MGENLSHMSSELLLFHMTNQNNFFIINSMYIVDWDIIIKLARGVPITFPHAYLVGVEM